ncbi:MAG: hypothetical protein JO159_01695 [Acidobacteria bacterium]|nr:hypothetical protein [Acidobacteriota bacterium]
MKAYVAITGVIFAIITALHIWRLFGEQQNASERVIMTVLTIIPAVLCVWAVRLLASSRRT